MFYQEDTAGDQRECFKVRNVPGRSQIESQMIDRLPTTTSPFWTQHFFITGKIRIEMQYICTGYGGILSTGTG
jgi:hypothetical protein